MAHGGSWHGPMRLLAHTLGPAKIFFPNVPGGLRRVCRPALFHARRRARLVLSRPLHRSSKIGISLQHSVIPENVIGDFCRVMNPSVAEQIDMARAARRLAAAGREPRWSRPCNKSSGGENSR